MSRCKPRDQALTPDPDVGFAFDNRAKWAPLWSPTTGTFERPDVDATERPTVHAARRHVLEGYGEREIEWFKAHGYRTLCKRCHAPRRDPGTRGVTRCNCRDAGTTDVLLERERRTPAPAQVGAGPCSARQWQRVPGAVLEHVPIVTLAKTGCTVTFPASLTAQPSGIRTLTAQPSGIRTPTVAPSALEQAIEHGAFSAAIAFERQREQLPAPARTALGLSYGANGPTRRHGDLVTLDPDAVDVQAWPLRANTATNRNRVRDEKRAAKREARQALVQVGDRSYEVRPSAWPDILAMTAGAFVPEPVRSTLNAALYTATAEGSAFDLAARALLTLRGASLVADAERRLAAREDPNGCSVRTGEGAAPAPSGSSRPPRPTPFAGPDLTRLPSRIATVEGREFRVVQWNAGDGFQNGCSDRIGEGATDAASRRSTSSLDGRSTTQAGALADV